MRRREFITLIGGAAAWPLEAHGQQAGRRYRIAVLGAPLPPSFFDDLGQAGFVKGGNVKFDGRGIGVASASYATVTAWRQVGGQRWPHRLCCLRERCRPRFRHRNRSVCRAV